MGAALRPVSYKIAMAGAPSYFGADILNAGLYVCRISGPQLRTAPQAHNNSSEPLLRDEGGTTRLTKDTLRCGIPLEGLTDV